MLNETVLAAMFLALSGAQPAAAAETPQKPQAAATTKPPAKDTIYGSQLMTPEERDAYREKMRAAKTQAERDQLRSQHHAEMQQRAKERGVTLPAQPKPRAGAGPRERPQGKGQGPGPGPGPAAR